MGCASTGDEIKESENDSKKLKKENEKNIKYKSHKNLNNNYNLMTTNSLNNLDSILSPIDKGSIFHSKRDKDKSFSLSIKQKEVKSKINIEVINKLENEQKEKRKEDEELEKNIEDDLVNYNFSSTERLNKDGDINIDKDNIIVNEMKIGPIFNIKERIKRKNNIKYAILEKDNESEDNSNSKNKKSKNENDNNKNKNKQKNKMEEYRDPKYNYCISRNQDNLENSTTNLNSIPTKFIRRYSTSPKKLDKNKLGYLLSNEEKKLTLSFENLVSLQTGKPSKKYKVLTVLGNGSYGKVYKAMNIKTENLVAIKSIKKNDNKTEGQDIKNEINVLKKLNHPNIVKIYEFYDIKDNYYLITEFCKFGELYKYINFHFSEKQLCVLFYQVFSGLIYLHENNIIHRDIKLENIMIDAIEKDNITTEPYFYIKIIDFGSAKFFSNKKKENQIIGSTYYIAPEVLKQKYNEKCDTWSAGVLLYMSLTKKAPFNGKNNDIIMEKIEEGNYDKKCKKLMEYSPEVRELLNNLLEVDVDKRFSARQALNHSWFKNFGGRDLFSNFSLDDLKIILDNLFNFKNLNKIQELVIAFLVHNSPSTNETLTILKIFRYFNTSGTCKLLKEELIEGLYKYKSKKEVDSIVEDLFIILDINKKGYIEYEEFLTASIDKSKLLTKENLKYAFQFIDKEKSNGIDVKKIINAFNADTNKILEAVFNNIIIKVDEDGDGIINFNEFQKLCLSNTFF